MTKKIVVVTEKKKQAQAIADAMGWSSGRNNWTGTFEGSRLVMIAASGHLLTQQNPDEVIPGLSWENPAELLHIPRKIPLKVAPNVNGKPDFLQPEQILEAIGQQLADADELIIATDSDREGEAIGWTIKEWLNFNGTVRRAWLSAGLDKKSVTEAMNNLRQPHETKGFFRAAEARTRSDWGYMFLVRAYTYYASFSCLGPNLGKGDRKSRVVSVGRVQSPATAMIVKRERDINEFVKTDHFKISASFMPRGETNSVAATYTPLVTQDVIDRDLTGVVWEPSKAVVVDGEPEPLDKPLFVGKKEVDAFRQRLIDASDSSFIKEYSGGSRSESPPKTFDLPEAQGELSDKLKISSGLAQTVLEDLYEQGWLSYARTAKSDLPLNLYEPETRNAMFAALYDLEEISQQAKFAASIHNGESDSYPPFMPKVFSKKQMEHYGIVPTGQVMTRSAFNGLRAQKKEGLKVLHTDDHMRKAYLIVSKQFIQAMYPPAKYSTQSLIVCVPVKDLLDHDESLFSSKAEKITDSGWRSAFDKGASKDTSIAIQKTGNPVSIVSVDLKALETSPPVRYTEVTFNKAMVNIGKTVRDPKLRLLLNNSEGLGTPATRKTVIATIKDRESVQMVGDSFKPTNKGIDLIGLLPNWLSNPETTAYWEDILVKISEEKDDDRAVSLRDQFVEAQYKRIEALIAQLIEQYSSNLGPRIGGDGRVSDKMKKLIKLIADKKGIPIDDSLLSNFESCQVFLNEHIDRSDTPSEKQLEFFDKIASNIPSSVKIPEGCRDSRKLVSAFIDSNLKYAPISDKQKALAEKLKGETPPGESFDENALLYKGAFDKLMKKNEKSGTKSSSKSASSRPKTAKAK